MCVQGIKKSILVAAIDIGLELKFLIGFWRNRPRPGSHNLVVSMTSYPARIRWSWLALESIFRQDYRDFTLVLVLSREQFRGVRLPRRIRLQMRKGLQILWVDEDNKSYDHLWPAYEKFPRSRIISVDDDKFFPPNLLSELVAQSDRTPDKIVAARGWEMRMNGGLLNFGDNWVRATLDSPSDILFLPPGNGSLYPVDSLPAMAGDTRTMREVCPNADDVWYWAMARLNGTSSVCLGLSPHRPIWRQKGTPALADNDPGPREFQSVMSFFGLRERVIAQIVEGDKKS